MSPREPEWWLWLAMVLLSVGLAALVWVWWLHGSGNRRLLTREVAVYYALIGLLRCWWDLGQGLALAALGVLLWRLARRLPGRPLDDRAVMGRSRAGGDDDDEEDDD